ncbi:MAG: hypothetical protein IT276_15490 [Ignavibacteriaceae bacterium]|nr:hypothetical protein [Ignavibacteriaceae bacterium]
MLPLLIGSIATSLVAKVVSEYLSDGIEKNYQEKRLRIQQRAKYEIQELEYQSREVILDMLSDAQNDAWEEINLIRKNYPKIKKQLNFARTHSNHFKDFSSKQTNSDFCLALSTYQEILRSREFFWHTLVKKYSAKKYDITTSSLRKRKILRRNFFAIPDSEQFLQNIPRKGFFCNSYVENISSQAIRLLCKNPINLGNKPFRCSLSLDHYPPSTAKWSTGSIYTTFVTSVNYYERRYTVNIPLTNLIKSISKNEYVFSSIPNPIKKKGKLVGYELASKGNNFFLPQSLSGSKLSLNGSIDVILIQENFDPFNLIVRVK